MLTTEEIKTLIHESIENIDDPKVLSMVRDLLERKYSPEQGFQLSPEQSRYLDEARAKIEIGEFLSNDQANALVDEWLRK